MSFARSHLSFGVLILVSFAVPNFAKCSLKCQIPLTVDPQCGTNGVTYQNIEELFCAKSLCFPDLFLAYSGSCQEEEFVQTIPTNQPKKIRTITPTRDPVLQLHSPISKPRARRPSPYGHSSAVTINEKSKSCDLTQCVCEYILFPVCGTDGLTYGNPCILECANKCDPSLEVYHTGFCGRIFFTPPLLEQKFFFRAFFPTDIQSSDLNSLS